MEKNIRDFKKTRGELERGERAWSVWNVSLVHLQTHHDSGENR